MTYTVNLGAVRAAWNAYGGQARGALDIAMAIPVKAGDAQGLGDLAPFLQTASARMDAMAQISATVIDSALQEMQKEGLISAEILAALNQAKSAAGSH